MKRQYDLVFSLGAACACTECLRRAGLQFSSFPFDWLAGSTLPRRTDLLVGDGEECLRRDLLVHVRSVSAVRTDAYRNTATDITFKHDFPAGEPLESSLPSVREKYDRRFARLRTLLGRGGRALAVYVTTPPAGIPPTVEEAASCRRRLMERFPNTAFDLLVLRYGENAEPRVERPQEGLAFATFDYHFRTDPTGANTVDRDRVVSFFRDLGLSARDYRSAAERHRHQDRQRSAEYARFGAKNVWEYLWTKLQYKLYRHLARRLSEKGLA